MPYAATLLAILTFLAGPVAAGPPQADTQPALADIRGNLKPHLELAGKAGLKEKAFRKAVAQAEAGAEDAEAAERALAAARGAIEFSRDIYPRLDQYRRVLPLAGMEARVLEALAKVAVDTFNDQEWGQSEEEFCPTVTRIRNAVRLATQSEAKLGQNKALLELRDRTIAAFNAGRFGPGKATFETLLARLDEATQARAERKPSKSASRPAGKDDPPATAPGPAQEEWLSNMLDLHNQARRRNNLQPLVLERRLTACAQKYAEFMAANNRFGHNERGTSAQRVREEGYVYRMAGENIAWGIPSVKGTFEGWMDSPPHKANILTPFTQAGFGLAWRKDRMGPVWVTVFGTPR